MKQPLLISFSGGRTSAYMAYLLSRDEEIGKQYESHIVFANTGLEHEHTLSFIDRFSRHFSLPVIWLEAVIQQGKGNGTRHKVVDFQTASRRGEPFYEMVRKYTLPNIRFRHCTRELKQAVIHSWARERFGTSNIPTAIGIRADEMRRVSKEVKNILYPLVNRYPSDKQDVLDFWSSQAFDLELPEYLGNCVPCFQKSDTKLLKALQECPEYFSLIEKMERDFPSGNNGQPVHFYRGNRDVRHLRALSEQTGSISDLFIHDGGCSESCEFLEAPA